MENRVKNMKKLPAKCEFKIILHTTQAAYFDIQTDPKLQVVAKPGPELSKIF
jgi:hypothetical protein